MDYGPKDVRHALVEASEGQHRHDAGPALLFCFQDDAAEGRSYALRGENLMQLGGVVCFWSWPWLTTVWRRECAGWSRGAPRNGLTVPGPVGRFSLKGADTFGCRARDRSRAKWTASSTSSCG